MRYYHGPSPQGTHVKMQEEEGEETGKQKEKHGGEEAAEGTSILRSSTLQQ